MVENLVRGAVHGGFSGIAVDGFNRYREARQSYSEVILGPVIQQNTVDAVTGLLVFTSYPRPAAQTIAGSAQVEGFLFALQPGQKAFQFRCWMISEDEENDSNQALPLMGIEIQVHRCLLFPDEEYFYVGNEMLDNQQSLLDRVAWRALSTLQDLVEGPAIDDVPTRESNVLSYTVTVSATVAPD